MITVCCVCACVQVAYAEYELDAIMLTGSCTEFAPGKQLPPPKGLELHLGTEQQQHRVRTRLLSGGSWRLGGVRMQCTVSLGPVSGWVQQACPQRVAWPTALCSTLLAQHHQVLGGGL
jgi:hypothetical protein